MLGQTSKHIHPSRGVTIGKYLKVTASYEDELGSGKTAQKETETQGMVHDRGSHQRIAVALIIAGLTTTLSVQENTPAGENIGDPFTASDALTLDETLTLTYSLSGSGRH